MKCALCYMSNCVTQEYQRHFHNMKEKLEQTPSERQFDFSEMYIFGKFDTFQRRLNKILEMFGTISIYSALQESKIEGLETMATRFQVGILLSLNVSFHSLMKCHWQPAEPGSLLSFRDVSEEQTLGC